MNPDTVINRPLCVDLDGSLLATDVLWESVLMLAKTKPGYLLHLLVWLFKGKAYFKRQLSHHVSLDPECLPYRKDVLAFIQKESKSGREIVLATASDEKTVDRIAQHFGCFSTVIASDGQINFNGKAKLAALEKVVGSQNFDYIGNEKRDLPIWAATKRAYIVNPSRSLLRKAQQVASIKKIFSSNNLRVSKLFKEIRVNQWVKNILLFVPLITSHKITEADLVLKIFVSFIAFSLCASSAYILNDLLDLEMDRSHPVKKHRPLAAGLIQIKTGLLFVPLLLILSLLVALLLPPLFRWGLFIYFMMTAAYSFYFKRIVIVDVLILAGFYTLRVLLGGIAVDISISAWLLAFSMFFFISLAFLKRYSELLIMQNINPQTNKRRGYMIEDKELLRSIGAISGYLSMLVLALYINSTEVKILYKDPAALWLIGPFFLYWITRIWFLAQRGDMQDDPIVFTVKDPKSYFVGIAVLIILLIAAKYPIFKNIIPDN